MSVLRKLTTFYAFVTTKKNLLDFTLIDATLTYLSSLRARKNVRNLER